MKGILSIVVLWVMYTTSSAQGGRHEEYLRHEGDNLYKDEQFALAIEYYRELVNLSDQQPEVLFRLAESYRKTFNYQEAEVYYLKAYYNSPEKYPLALYNYALMLKLNGSFDESIRFFNDFIVSAEGQPKLKEYVEQAVIDQIIPNAITTGRRELHKSKVATVTHQFGGDAAARSAFASFSRSRP